MLLAMTGRGRPTRRAGAGAICLLALLSHCDDGRSMTTTVDAQVSSPDTAPAAAPGLTELHLEVLEPSCVLGRCHITQAPAGDLSLTGRRVSVYDSLVNAPSTGAPGRIRVVPFDPESSYLLEKLGSPTPTAGTQMPPFGALPEAAIARVVAWIEAGAQDD